MAERMLFFAQHNNKKASKYRLTEYAAMTRFSSRFESAETVNNKELYDTNVLKCLLLVLTNRDKEVNQLAHSFLISDAYRLRVFSPSKIKSLIEEGKYLEACAKLEDIVDKKWNYLIPDTCRLFYKVFICLCEYFDFLEYSKKYEAEALKVLSKVLAYSFTLVAEVYCLKEYASLSDKEKEEYINSGSNSKSKKDNSWDSMVKNNPLKGEYLTFSKDKSRNEELVLMYETVFKYWYDDLYNMDRGLRNARQTLDDLELKNDWSLLFQVMDKNYFKQPSSYLGTFQEAFAPREKHSHKMKYEEDTAFVDYIYSMVAESIYGHLIAFTKDIFNALAGAQYVDFYNRTNKEKGDLAGEIKDLKAANRNLTKSVTKLGADNDQLKALIEKDKVELEQVRKVEAESEELIELRKKVEELIQQNSELSADLKKSENKNDWLTKKNSELESDLKTYDGVEQSLMLLQNENNVLLADIERLELLDENEEDGEAEFERKLNAIREEPILFLGGTGDMMNRYLELFPNSENVNISDNTPNFTIPTRIKYVAIYTKVVKHSFCERAESLIGKENIIFLNILNKKLVVDELYKNIIGHKK